MRINSHAIRDLLQNVACKFGVPCITLSITLRGESATFSAGVLQTDGELTYDLASIRKLLASLAALHLVARGELSLDAPVVTHLPELAETPRAASLRIWHLLSNTSGCGSMLPQSGGESGYFTLAGLLDFVRHSPQVFVPGSVFSYQLEDYRLLAEILRRITGREIPALIQECVLQPLHIDVTAGQPAPRYRFEPSSRTFQPSPAGNPWAEIDDGMRMAPLTTAALGIIANALARGDGDSPPRPLVGAHLLLSRRTPIPVAPESALSPHTFCAYGLGCGVYPDGTLGHGGSSDGQCCALRFDTRLQLGVALTLSANVPQMRDMMLTAILRLCGHPPEAPCRPLQPQRFDADELIGRYFGGDAARCLQIRRRGAELVCALPPVIGSTQEDSLGSAPLEAVFMLNNGVPCLHPASRHLCAAFFREPDGIVPCVMLGGRAFRRCDAD